VGVSGFLLDTHAVAWWWTQGSRLTDTARALIESEVRTIYVSAVTPWEMATKFRIGKWPEVGELLPGFEGFLARSRLTGLQISMDHARLAGSPSTAHRDPFDRMLAAQAIAESLTMVSGDPAFAAFGVTCVWREDHP
jgi:PIN domain nuclease of toxin-antitoxin system